MSEGYSGSGSPTDAAIKLVAEALQVDADEVEPGTGIGVTERWDSLAHMRLVLLLEGHVGRPMDSETMLGIESLKDVISYLDKA